MKEYFEFYNVANLRLVDVRRYEGIDNGKHAWIFLGYDVVIVDKDDNATSIIAEDKIDYKFLKPLNNDEECGFFDHNGLIKGDIRAKVVGSSLGMFGKLPIVSRGYIKKWVEARQEFSFLHYQPTKEQGKVKKLGEKK